MAKKSPVTSNGHGPTRVAIYARVSSDEQKRKETVKTQLEECRRYAKQNGLTVAGEYVDEGVSGSGVCHQAR